MNQGGEDTFK